MNHHGSFCNLRRAPNTPDFQILACIGKKKIREMTATECVKSHLWESTFLLSHVCVSFSFLSWLMRCVCLRVLPRCREDEEPPAIVRVCLCCLRCSLVVKDWKGDDPIFGSSHTLVTPSQTHRWPKAVAQDWGKDRWGKKQMFMLLKY